MWVTLQITFFSVKLHYKKQEGMNSGRHRSKLTIHAGIEEHPVVLPLAGTPISAGFPSPADD